MLEQNPFICSRTATLSRCKTEDPINNVRSSLFRLSVNILIFTTRSCSYITRIECSAVMCCVGGIHFV